MPRPTPGAGDVRGVEQPPHGAAIPLAALLSRGEATTASMEEMLPNDLVAPTNGSNAAPPDDDDDIISMQQMNSTSLPNNAPSSSSGLPRRLSFDNAVPTPNKPHSAPTPLLSIPEEPMDRPAYDDVDFEQPPEAMPLPLRRSNRLACVTGRTYDSTHGMPCTIVGPDPNPQIKDSWLVKFPIGPTNPDPEAVYSVDIDSIRSELGEANLADYIMDQDTHDNLVNRQLLDANAPLAMTYEMKQPITKSLMQDTQREHANNINSCMWSPMWFDGMLLPDCPFSARSRARSLAHSLARSLAYLLRYFHFITWWHVPAPSSPELQQCSAYSQQQQFAQRLRTTSFHFRRTYGTARFTSQSYRRRTAHRHCSNRRCTVRLGPAPFKGGDTN
jgi:hypothetical protein